MSQLPIVDTHTAPEKEYGCPYCNKQWVGSGFASTGLIPVVLEKDIQEWGPEKCWDMQTIVSCSCTPGLARTTDAARPMMNFDRAVALGLIVGWQVRKMRWYERKHYLIFGGPENAAAAPTGTFAEMMETIGGKK